MNISLRAMVLLAAFVMGSEFVSFASAADDSKMKSYKCSSPVSMAARGAMPDRVVQATSEADAVNKAAAQYAIMTTPNRSPEQTYTRCVSQ